MGHLQEGKRIYVSASDPAYINRPNIDGGKFFCNGEIREWTGAMQTVYAPIFLEGTEVRRARLGYPQVFSSIETVFLGFVAREASRHLGYRNKRGYAGVTRSTNTLNLNPCACRTRWRSDGRLG